VGCKYRQIFKSTPRLNFPGSQGKSGVASQDKLATPGFPGSPGQAGDTRA